MHAEHAPTRNTAEAEFVLIQSLAPCARQEALTGLLGRHPEFARGWIALAELYCSVQRKEDALETVEKALAIDPHLRERMPSVLGALVVGEDRPANGNRDGEVSSEGPELDAGQGRAASEIYEGVEVYMESSMVVDVADIDDAVDQAVGWERRGDTEADDGANEDPSVARARAESSADTMQFDSPYEMLEYVAAAAARSSAVLDAVPQSTDLEDSGSVESIGRHLAVALEQPYIGDRVAGLLELFARYPDHPPVLYHLAIQARRAGKSEVANAASDRLRSLSPERFRQLCMLTVSPLPDPVEARSTGALVLAGATAGMAGLSWPISFQAGTATEQVRRQAWISRSAITIAVTITCSVLAGALFGVVGL